MTAEKWTLDLKPNKTTQQLNVEREQRAWATFEDALRMALAHPRECGDIRATVNMYDLTDEQCDCARKQLDELFGEDQIEENCNQSVFIIKHVKTELPAPNIRTRDT